MHIPGCPTAELDILPFADALAAAEGPSPDYDAQRWLYVPNVYTEYRYILATRGEHPLICVGVNPSTAAPGDLDPTLKSVERVALHNGFDSFIMFNVYAQRPPGPRTWRRSATSPSTGRTWPPSPTPCPCHPPRRYGPPGVP